MDTPQVPPFDDILKAAPFRELHHRIVSAPIDEVWPHCLDVTAAEIRMIGPLFALRGLPGRLTGKRPPDASAPEPLLDVFADQGFIILRRDAAPVDGRASIIFGAAGRFWSPRGNHPKRFDRPADFLDFDEPGNAKTVARLDAIDNGDGTTRIETETLVAGTDTAGSRRFAPYWALIRLPSGLIRRSWLAAIDRRVSG
ncbi:MAG: hypothetical protein WBD41_01180 [Rhodococcus sp. (in: high G+C Gram-positive bacteria)]